jgi:hypothetical protein
MNFGARLLEEPKERAICGCRLQLKILPERKISDRHEKAKAYSEFLVESECCVTTHPRCVMGDAPYEMRSMAWGSM